MAAGDAAICVDDDLGADVTGRDQPTTRRLQASRSTATQNLALGGGVLGDGAHQGGRALGG